jgi:ribosomal protein L12E/L44/L45/RPP1/RPP2
MAERVEFMAEPMEEQVETIAQVYAGRAKPGGQRPTQASGAKAKQEERKKEERQTSPQVPAS